MPSAKKSRKIVAWVLEVSNPAVYIFATVGNILLLALRNNNFV